MKGQWTMKCCISSIIKYHGENVVTNLRISGCVIYCTNIWLLLFYNLEIMVSICWKLWFPCLQNSWFHPSKKIHIEGNNQTTKNGKETDEKYFPFPMQNNNNEYITDFVFRNFWPNEKEGISLENTPTLFCVAGKWSQLGIAHFCHMQPHSYFHVQVEGSSTDTTLPLSLFSLCSLLLLLTISSITKSSKTPTRIQEMVTSIFSPSLVPSPSSLCTTDLMRGGIVPESRGMALEAYQWGQKLTSQGIRHLVAPAAGRAPTRIFLFGVEVTFVCLWTHNQALVMRDCRDRDYQKSRGTAFID